MVPYSRDAWRKAVPGTERFRGEDRASSRHTLTCMSSCVLRIRPELDKVQTVCRALTGFLDAYPRLPALPRRPSSRRPSSAYPSGMFDEPKREPDPERLPDSNDPSGPCVRCGRTSNFEVLGNLPVTFDGGWAEPPSGRPYPTFNEQVSALRCYGCKQVTVVVEEEWVGERRSAEGRKHGGTISWRGIHWWPTPGSAHLDEAIPETIRSALSEGVRCLSAGAPRAAATMFRRTLEAVVRDCGSDVAVKKLDDENLAAALGKMADERTLDRSLADWAKELRLAGNVGGHLDPIDDVSRGEASDLSSLLGGVLTYLYEMPAKLRRVRGKGGPTPPS
jgi:hypothetical protein